MAGPFRAPDVQRVGGLTTFKQRRLASDRSTAYDYTNQAFNALLRFFGPQTVMPRVHWGEGQVAPGTPLSRGQQAAAWPKNYHMAEPGGSVGMRLPDLADINFTDKKFPTTQRFVRQQVLDRLIHEFAHTQQFPQFLTAKNRQVEMEGGADAFAHMTRNYVDRSVGLGAPRVPYVGYPNLEGMFRRKHSQNYALFGQFGQRGR